MIIAMRKMPYEQLRDSLDPGARMIVLSCNNCARVYGLGGRAGLQALADKLCADGLDVVHRELIGFACAVDLVGKRARDPATRDAFAAADVILPLACEHGQMAVRMAFPDKQVPELSRTLGVGWWNASTVRLTHCVSGVDLTIEGPEGMPLDEVAERTGLLAGPF